MNHFAYIFLLAVSSCNTGEIDETPGTPSPRRDECADSDECKREGNCHTEFTSTTSVEEFGSKGHEIKRSTSKKCVAKTKAHCEQSQRCKAYGACSLRADNLGGCGAASDAECRSSDECKVRGLCGPPIDYGFCRSSSDADCAASTECRERGHCVLHLETNRKVGICGPKTAADCKAAPACRTHGRCTMKNNSISIPQCIAGSDADCAKSEVCRTDGACRQWPNGDSCTQRK